jgi:regulation of enolase protein 1 (concanavalin A-like superfamily)
MGDEGPELRVAAAPASDFWQKTHYGYAHDNGHFFGCPTAGDFTADLHVRAEYKQLYDRAVFAEFNVAKV